MVPTLVENSKKKLCTCLLTYFLLTIQLLLLMNPRIPHQKKEMTLHAPAINYRLSIHYALLLAMYVQPVTQHYESRTVRKAIKVATVKNTDGFHYEGKPSRATAKIDTFCC